jgi:hypothetical protein
VKTEENKQVAIEERELKKKLLREKSKTRILTIVVATTVTISNIKVFELIEFYENEDDTDEILAEVQSHHVRFTDLSIDEIVKIFNEKFKSINLYKFRHERILDHEFFENQTRIEIENDQLKNLKKTVESYKDYEKSFYEVYAEIFINYLQMTTSLFVKISSNLSVTLIKYYQKILNLIKLYD